MNLTRKGAKMVRLFLMTLVCFGMVYTPAHAQTGRKRREPKSKTERRSTGGAKRANPRNPVRKGKRREGKRSTTTPREPFSTPTPLVRPNEPTLPRILQVDPSAGPPQGENTITIIGQGFNRNTAVRIAGRELTPILKDGSGTRMQVHIPNGSYQPGPTDVVIFDRNGGVLDTLPDGYTFIESKLFWLEPSRGGTQGGTKVRVTGQYLKGLRSEDVIIGGKYVTTLTGSDDGRTLYLETPPNKPGCFDVVLHNIYGQRTVLQQGFCYFNISEPQDDSPVGWMGRFSITVLGVDVADPGRSLSRDSTGREGLWSFHVFLNGNTLFQLPTRVYQAPGTAIGLSEEVTVYDPTLRVRILGLRGGTWAEGATTVSGSEVLRMLGPSPSAEAEPLRIKLPVRAGDPTRGDFTFYLNVKKLN